MVSQDGSGWAVVKARVTQLVINLIITLILGSIVESVL